MLVEDCFCIWITIVGLSYEKRNAWKEQKHSWHISLLLFLMGNVTKASGGGVGTGKMHVLFIFFMGPQHTDKSLTAIRVLEKLDFSHWNCKLTLQPVRYWSCKVKMIELQSRKHKLCCSNYMQECKWTISRFRKVSCKNFMENKLPVSNVYLRSVNMWPFSLLTWMLMQTFWQVSSFT